LENWPKLTGSKFGDAMFLFDNAIVVGILKFSTPISSSGHHFSIIFVSFQRSMAVAFRGSKLSRPIGNTSKSSFGYDYWTAG
jgi:hypothetical protein